MGVGVVGPTVETYTYDGLDRVTQAVSGPVATDLAYDSLSRVLSEATNGKVIGYSFDDVSNLTEVLYPSALRLGLSHDALDRPLTIGSKAGEGDAFQITSAVDYAYRGPYLRARKSLANGVDMASEFDDARRLVEISASSSVAGTPYQERLSWTARNLKASQVRGDLGGAGRIHGYDGASRLEPPSFQPRLSLQQQRHAEHGTDAPGAGGRGI